MSLACLLYTSGEGEDEVPELLELYRRAKREGWTKSRFLRAAADIQGVYVPSLYDVTYHDDGAVRAITPLDGAPAKVYKRVVHDMDKSYFPAKTIVPSTEVVHDRVTLELFRGCIRGCRFPHNQNHRHYRSHLCHVSKKRVHI